MSSHPDVDPAEIRGTIRVTEAGYFGQRGPVLEIYDKPTGKSASIEVPDVPENAALVKALRTLGTILGHTADENTTPSP